MTTRRSETFRHDAVRIALTSGLTRRQVSSNLGVGLSPLKEWIKNHGDEGLVDTADADLLRENERLRCEIPLTGSICLHV